MKTIEDELKELEPYLLDYERARVAKNLRYWRRKKRMTRKTIACGIMSVNKLRAYEKDSRRISLSHVFALAERFDVCGATLMEKRKCFD